MALKKFIRQMHVDVSLQWWENNTRKFSLPISLYLSLVAFRSRESSPGKKLKFREGKYLAGSVPEYIIFFLFSRSSPLLPPEETILFRGRMIYIKEMLFGNKQSGNEGRRQLHRALGWIILATQRKKTDESRE